LSLKPIRLEPATAGLSRIGSDYQVFERRICNLNGHFEPSEESRIFMQLRFFAWLRMTKKIVYQPSDRPRAPKTENRRKG
jgi:hypothetical protein